MVRQPGDHGVVDPPLAQRGLRQLHGEPHHGRALPRVQDLGPVRHRHYDRGHEAGRARQQPSH